MRSGPFPSLSLESERLFEPSRARAWPRSRASRRRKICAASSTSPCSRHSVPKLSVANVSSVSSCLSAEPSGDRFRPRPGRPEARRDSRSPGSRRTACSRWCDRVREGAGPAIQVAGQPVRLRLLRAGLEDGAHLVKAPSGSLSSSSALARIRRASTYCGKPLEPLAAEPDGVAAPPGLAIGVGQRREGQRRGIPGQPVLISTDRAEGSRIIGRQGPADRRDRVMPSHLSLYAAARGGVNHSSTLRRLSAWPE